MIAALSFAPLPLYLARRADPNLAHAPLVHVEDGRVLHANGLAHRRGISPGMLLDGARLRVEGLQVTSTTEPDLQHGWHELLAELYSFTPWLEGARRGLAFVEIDPAEAAELARRFDVSVGVAQSCELAELAALATSPGACRHVSPDEKGEAAFFARLPLRFLRGVALSARNLIRLEWLGLGSVADLAAWTAAQVRSYLAEEGEALLSYLHGPRRDTLRPFNMPETLARSLAFHYPIREPRQLVPALERLSTELERALDGRAAHRLTLIAELGNSQRRATRLSKRPLSEAKHIRQQAMFALHDSDVAGKRVERLTIELAEPERIALQEGLWPRRERRSRALESTFQRFPNAPRRLEWSDPYAQADDLAWSWRTYSDDLDVESSAPELIGAAKRPPRPGAGLARRAGAAARGARPARATAASLRARPSAAPGTIRAATIAEPLFTEQLSGPATTSSTHTPTASTTTARLHAPTVDPRHGDLEHHDFEHHDFEHGDLEHSSLEHLDPVHAPGALHGELGRTWPAGTLGTRSLAAAP